MDTLEFIASLVRSLAWPLAATILVVILRKPLASILAGRSGRLKAGPLEMEWDRLLEATEASIERTPAMKSLPSESNEIAELAPVGAVLQAYSEIERALRQRLESVGVKQEEIQRSGGRQLARVAADHGVVSPETLNSIEGMVLLRNLAAHGQEYELSISRAREYLLLADAVIYSINQGGQSQKK